jgi:hypothetical protein
MKLYLLYLYFRKEDKYVIIEDSYNTLYEKFIKEYRMNYDLSIDQREALIGIILGDCYLERRKLLIIHDW